MKCLACGTELDNDDRFCPNCGSERTKIVNRVETFPPEIRELVDMVAGTLSQYDVTTETAQKNGELKIMSTGDLYNVPEHLKGSIFTTGTITFSEGRSYYLDYDYSGKTKLSAVFRNVAVICRVDGENKNIAVYSDMEEYHMGTDVLGSQSMNDISGKHPIVIMRYNEKFYICCRKGGFYVRIENTPLNPNSIHRISVNQRIEVNNHSALKVRLA